MIPKVLPPLLDLAVLVTRPAAQCEALCAEIEQHGGTAVAFPAIEIVPIQDVPLAAGDYELIVFVSVNAVEHGAQWVRKGPATRIAAIGRATAAALARIRMPADIVPDAGFTSEALLAHPGLQLRSDSRILIVRGAGGRELLKETLLAQGMSVDTCEVYRRACPQSDMNARAQVETRWTEEGIDVVTITSVETLANLTALLSERGQELLRATSLLVPSKRVLDAAASAGMRGEMIIAPGADDASMIGALAQWRMRARLL